MSDLAMMTAGFSMASGKYKMVLAGAKLDMTKVAKVALTSLILVLSEKFEGLVNALKRPKMALLLNKSKSRLLRR